MVDAVSKCNRVLAIFLVSFLLVLSIMIIQKNINAIHVRVLYACLASVSLLLATNFNVSRVLRPSATGFGIGKSSIMAGFSSG